MSAAESTLNIATAAAEISARRVADLEATLRDIRLGCDMMLQPVMQLSPFMRRYVEEVHRVATAGLQQ